MAIADTEALIATRRALHVVAEHVLMPDLHDHTSRIGLRPAPGGFATPAYAHSGGFTRRLRVSGTEVIDEHDGDPVARVPLTSFLTLGGLRAALQVTAPAPADIYDLGSDGSPRQTLAVDPGSAALVAELFAVVHGALTTLQDEARIEPDRSDPDESISSIQLWPEHFDLAASIDEVTYGASPGDDAHPEPYCYVAPWAPPPSGEPWNEAFGVSRPARPVPPAAEVLTWFRRMRTSARP